MRGEYEQYMTEIECPACKGRRLKPEILAVTVGGKNISEVTDMNIAEIKAFFVFRDNFEIGMYEFEVGLISSRFVSYTFIEDTFFVSSNFV